MKEDQYKVPDDSAKSKKKLDNDIFKPRFKRRKRPEYYIPEGTELLRLSDSMEITLSSEAVNDENQLNLTRKILVLAGVLILLLATNGNLYFAYGFGLLLVGMICSFVTTLILDRFTKKRYIITKDSIYYKESLGKTDLKSRKFETDRILQVFVREVKLRERIGDQTEKQYDLCATTSGDGKIIRIVGNCNLETALYLEQEMEEFLEIRDKYIKLELRNIKKIPSNLD